MLRCLMHILVSAEPMSLVAPGETKQQHSHQTTSLILIRNWNVSTNKAMTLQNKMPADDTMGFGSLRGRPHQEL